MLSYLWQEKLKREGKYPFQELLQLLANRQKDDVDDQVGTIIVLFGKILMYIVYIQVVEGGVPDYLFCGHELNTKNEQKKHFCNKIVFIFRFWFSISCNIGFVYNHC